MSTLYTEKLPIGTKFMVHSNNSYIVVDESPEEDWVFIYSPRNLQVVRLLNKDGSLGVKKCITLPTRGIFNVTYPSQKPLKKLKWV